MSIRYLKTLIAIADHGSFGAAADVVHITQSAVSMQMKALEDEIRTELFDRTKRPPVLNAYGRRVVQRARDVVFLYDQMIDDAADAHDLAGKLTFGAVPTTLTGIVPHGLAAMKASYPNLQISVISGLSVPLVELLQRGDIDAALISQPSHALDRVSWTPVVSEPLMVIAPVDAFGTTAREILESHPYIQFNRRAWVGRMIEQLLRESCISVRVSMELDTLEAISTMVHHGLGASIVPAPCVEPPTRIPLKRVPFGGVANRRILGIAEPDPNPKARLTAALSAEFARLGHKCQPQNSTPVSA